MAFGGIDVPEISRRRFLAGAGLTILGARPIGGGLLRAVAASAANPYPPHEPLRSINLPVRTLKSAMNPTFPPDSVPENVLKVGDRYWCVGMGWSTSDVRLWSSASPEGPWESFDGNPILTAGSQPWEGAMAYAPCLATDGSSFYLYYSSADHADIHGSIGLAIASSVGGPYVKFAGNPVMRYDSGPSWHDGRVSECSVIFDSGLWRMAFMGSRAANSHGTEQVGIATAPDPHGPWFESPMNPILGFGTGFDSTCVADPSLFKVGDRYWMWYSGGNGAAYRTGLAWADRWEGPWSKKAENPVLQDGPHGSFDSHAAFRGSAFVDAETVHVVYAGNDLAGFKGAMRGGNAIIVPSG